jgi:hypothetical protein
MLPRQSGATEYRDAPITRRCSYHSVFVARGGRNCPRTHLDVFGYFERVVHRRGSMQILPLGLMQVPGENLVVGIGTCPFCTTHAKGSLSVRLKPQRTPRPNIITRAESPPVLKERELTHSYAPVWSLDGWLRSMPVPGHNKHRTNVAAGWSDGATANTSPNSIVDSTIQRLHRPTNLKYYHKALAHSTQ